jgi:hypothetical protein
VLIRMGVQNNMKPIFLLKGTVVKFDYTNWEGKKGTRTVMVNEFFYGSTPYHKEPQFILDGFDLDKEAKRGYALKDVTNLTVIG